MDQPTTAIIIPFPARHRGELARSTDRLTVALAGLSASLELQRTAMQRWRTALLNLSEQLKNAGAQTD